ncbi:MAG: hypothetical protein IAE85_10840 [Anaerolinea sp.]|nr:hypothetical protein [Anaerolinea sp.]
MEHHNETREGVAVLVVLAAFSLLMALSLIGGAPDPLALAQVHATDTPTVGSPLVSPLNGPTNTPPPRPVARPIEFITNATEAYVLSHRYSPMKAFDATQNEAPDEVEPGGQQVERSPDAGGLLYLPLIRRHLGDLVWRKGAGDGRNQSAQFGFVSKLIPSWWYNWRHDHPVSAGALDDPRYAPMVWCPMLPGESGIPNGHWNPEELVAKVRQYPGRTWLIYNEPDFPPSSTYPTATPLPTPSGTPPVVHRAGFQQCAQYLCKLANYATLAPEKTLPPSTTPTPTASFTPTPTRPPGATPSATPTEVWPCYWDPATPIPAYYNQLTAKMLRITADRYAQIYRLIKQNDPTAKVFCCGNFHGMFTTWWEDFLAYLRDYHGDVKIDGVAIHAYPWSKSISDCALEENRQMIWGCMEGELQEFRLKHEAELLQPRTPLVPNAPIWITEIGYLAGPWTYTPTPAATLTYQEVRDYLMQPMVVWLQSGSAGYQAVSWYVMLDDDPDTPLETNQFVYPAPSATPSALTILGSTWASVTPPTVTPTP